MIVIGEASESSERHQNGDEIEWHDQFRMKIRIFFPEGERFESQSSYLYGLIYTGVHTQTHVLVQ